MLPRGTVTDVDPAGAMLEDLPIPGNQLCAAFIPKNGASPLLAEPWEAHRLHTGGVEFQQCISQEQAADEFCLAQTTRLIKN